jgi:hypothetical protein
MHHSISYCFAMQQAVLIRHSQRIDQDEIHAEAIDRSRVHYLNQLQSRKESQEGRNNFDLRIEI